MHARLYFKVQRETKHHIHLKPRFLVSFFAFLYLAERAINGPEGNDVLIIIKTIKGAALRCSRLL